MEEIRTLIDQIKNKQSALACTQVVDMYKVRVFTFCMRMVRHSEIAEELAQDAFLKAFKQIHQLRDPDKFYPWLMKLTYHIVIDFLRKKKTEYDPLEVAGSIASQDDPHLDLVQKERRRKIEEIFGRFQAEDRAVLTLYYLEDQSIQQIETITGLSRSTIKVKLFRAREKLKTEVRKISHLL